MSANLCANICAHLKQSFKFVDNNHIIRELAALKIKTDFMVLL